MDPVQEQSQSHLGFLRIEAKDAKTLLAEENIPCRDVAGPAPRMAEPLTFGEISFASPQRFFRLLALRDVAVDSTV